MKKIIYILLLALLLPLIPACNEDDLDVTLYGARPEKEFYRNLDEINESLTVCYYFMKWSWQEMNAKLLFFNDVASDDCDKGGQSLSDEADWEKLESFNIFTSNGQVYDLWKTCYKGIYQVNTLLDNAQIFRGNNPDLSENDLNRLNRYENEARWIRGYFYFHLAYFFGDVPLFLHQELEDYYKERMPVEQVWEQVIKDFTSATALPKRSEYAPEDLGRVTSGAAYAMLGRTHWFLRDFTNAKKALAVLVDGEQRGEYKLDPDFATQWINHNSNVQESVFEIQYKSNGKDWDMSTGWNGVWFIPSCDNGYEMHIPTKQLYDDFDPEDPRITWTFVKQGDQFAGNAKPVSSGSYPSRMYDRKHYFPSSETLGAPSPIYPQDLKATNYVIRYADVLLMYAETLLEAGDPTMACKQINKVRKRARESSPLDVKRSTQKYIPATKPTSLPDIDSTDPEVVRKAIWRERRCELACEGLRRMDLIQQQRYGKVMTDYYNNKTITKENPDKGKFYTKEKELMPIPQKEREKSKGSLSQNPGY